MLRVARSTVLLLNATLVCATGALGNTVSATSSQGFPGWRQWIEVSLATEGPELNILSTDLEFDGERARIQSVRGKPICEVDPGHGKEGFFGIHPIGCYSDECTTLRAVLIEFSAIEGIPSGPLFRCRFDIQPDAEPGRYPLNVTGEGASVTLEDDGYKADVTGSTTEIAVRQACGPCGCPSTIEDRRDAIVIELTGSFILDNEDRSWEATLRAIASTGLMSGHLEFDEPVEGVAGANLSGTFYGPFFQLRSSAGEELAFAFDAAIDGDTAGGSVSWGGSAPSDWVGTAELKNPFRRASASIVEGLREGNPQDAIVSVIGDDIRKATQHLPNRERIPERRRLYDLRKEELWAALPDARIEVIRNHENLSTVFVRIHDLASLEALLQHPLLFYAYENRVITITPVRTRKPTVAAPSALQPIGVLEVPTIEKLLPECSGGTCPGDCNHDGRVTIAELLVATRIFLGHADILECSAIDVDADGAAGVSELVGAANRATDGCPTAP